MLPCLVCDGLLVWSGESNTWNRSSVVLTFGSSESRYSRTRGLFPDEAILNGASSLTTTAEKSLVGVVSNKVGTEVTYFKGLDVGFSP